MIDEGTKQDMQTVMNGILQEIVGEAFKLNRKRESLWHYTRPDSLLKIVELKSLRASHIRFMNDSVEYSHAINLAMEAIEATRAVNVLSRAYAVQAAFERNLTMGLGLDSSNIVFAASLSGKRDDLSQWRAYGGPEGGVSIGFDFDRLMGSVTRLGSTWRLLPIEYSVVRQRKYAKLIATEGVKLYEKCCRVAGKDVDVDDFAFEYMKEATLVASIIKHNAFRAENEWRLVKILDPPDPTDVKFFAKETVVVPAFDFDLSHPAVSGRIPLSEIVVGPGRMAEHSAAAIRALLVQRGYPIHPQFRNGQSVRVTTSGVPYRVIN